MNQHPTLQILLAKETTNPNPRQAAAALLKKAPEGATHAVLYADRRRLSWRILFVPSEGLPNLAQASRSRAGGLPAVATAPVSRPLP